MQLACIKLTSLFLNADESDCVQCFICFSCTPQELLENNRNEITSALMKSYPQLLQKYIADKAKISPLVEIIMLLKLELYTLKRQEQVTCCLLAQLLFISVFCFFYFVHLIVEFSDCS